MKARRNAKQDTMILLTMGLLFITGVGYLTANSVPTAQVQK